MKHATAIAALMVLVGCAAERGGMVAPRYISVFVDANGCQYLTSYDGGITPRLSPDGKQICEETDDE